MPSVRSTKLRSSKSTIRSKLRSVTPEDVESWNHACIDFKGAMHKLQPSDINEPWSYSFRHGERVWVRTTGGSWHLGKVKGEPRQLQEDTKQIGLFYLVIYRRNLRKYFAPLNGEIKPDTSFIRNMIEEAGGYDIARA